MKKFLNIINFPIFFLFGISINRVFFHTVSSPIWIFVFFITFIYTVWYISYIFINR